MITEKTRKKYPIYDMRINGTHSRLGKFIQVHQDLDEGMILGVNDESQIKNEKFRDSKAIKDMMIKSKNNDILGKRTEVEAKELIRNSDIIICFGVSFGQTDKIWWEEINSRILSNSYERFLFIFDIINDEDYKKNRLFPNKIRKSKDEKILNLFKILNEDCKSIDIENYYNKVEVLLNTEIFKFDILKDEDQHKVLEKEIINISSNEVAVTNK